MVGGKLDTLAGTIPSLDTIIGKLTGGESIAGLAEELKAASSGLKDKYTEYYIKVSQKVAYNQGYVEKELARLEGIIKKGNLAPEKIDDLTSRSNILRKFKGEEPIEEEPSKQEL